VFRASSAILWLQDTLKIYFPLKSGQEDFPRRRGMSSRASNSSVQGVGGHSGLQHSLGSISRRIGHYGLRYPEQSDLDCLAAFCCSSLTAKICRAWELSRLAAGHRGAAFRP
jgi:hypothetical protein